MKQELQEKLFEEYPDFFKEKDLTIEESCMAWGITCDDGWYTLLNELCRQIKHHLKCYNNQADRHAKKNGLEHESLTFNVTQVKEKFGGLRFHHDEADDITRGLVTMAEAMSFHICEVCGNAGKYTMINKSSVATRCKMHS